MKLIAPFDLEALGVNSADSIHLLTESMNLAYRDRNQFLGDPDQIDIPIRRLLSQSNIDNLRNQLNLNSHTIRSSYRYWPLLVAMVVEGEKHDF